MSNTESDSRFRAFNDYDFEKDEKFQSGVASLLQNKQENEDELLEKAKLFYYTKFVDSFDLDAYKEWKEKNHPPTIESDTTEKDDIEKPPRFTFQELVDMIEKGIEIPGIKQIPNILNEGKPSEAKMTARPKPWEIKNQDKEEKSE